jgi:PncC family amidohydrolase
LAESCTAGLISSLLACVPGASGVFWGSFVCYTKEAKVSMLELNDKELDTNGLVSRETACSMAVNALQKSSANIAASVTGFAGPSADGSGVPMGTIWIATALQGGAVNAKEFHFTGSRNAVRIQAAISVFEQMLDII